MIDPKRRKARLPAQPTGYAGAGQSSSRQREGQTMRTRALTVMVAVAGTVALSATPASAAVGWKAVDTNSNWSCGGYKSHPLSGQLKLKVCIVRNSNGDAQAIVVVQNTTGVPVSISGAVRSDFGSNVDCAGTTLNTGFTRGCFAGTATDVTDRTFLNATGYLEANGVTASVGHGIANT
ncbi:hypothetical protein [Streptomyces sp. Root1310]|uniref:hypothetical protein n=1 Tax=Streptomyces sp. Root1310 TaxID=1736452 RepID=UPI001F5B093C|nr:hypothetical protein [Streptomyces sp. Root1310]